VLVTEDGTVRLALWSLPTQGVSLIELHAAHIAGEITRVRPAVVVLDLDAAESGHETLVAIRSVLWTTPLIVLSRRSDEGDKVAALDLGADDYISKPVGASELLARIRVGLRHARGRPREDDVVEVGPLRIDLVRYEVRVDGDAVHLTPTEFRVLGLLARDAGRVVRRERLLAEIGSGSEGGHHLRVHIAGIRRKIERHADRPRWVVTVTGIGYRLRDE
jgi:two-component system KDP operon response regulator KdpE